MQTVDLTVPVPKQRKRPVNYNSKSLDWIRDHGYTNLDRREHYDVHANRKIDGHGFIDYEALSDECTTAFQMCGLDFAPHIKKITGERHDRVIAWLRCPARKLILIGWRKLQGKWAPKVADFWLENGELVWKERC